jgi:hypothetical protein
MKSKIDPHSTVKKMGDFTRRGLAIHSKTNEMVNFAATNPIPSIVGLAATTKNEHGNIIVGNNNELLFVPHDNQQGSPKYWRLKIKRAMSIFSE